MHRCPVVAAAGAYSLAVAAYCIPGCSSAAVTGPLLRCCCHRVLLSRFSLKPAADAPRHIDNASESLASFIAAAAINIAICHPPLFDEYPTVNAGATCHSSALREPCTAALCAAVRRSHLGGSVRLEAEGFMLPPSPWQLRVLVAAF